jgi:predicted anti-sigma-YlaC factor YlaD
MMNCPKVRALVTEFLEGALGAVNRARFEFHIWWCRDCRVHVVKMRQLIDATGRLPADEDLPDHLREIARRGPGEPPTRG